MAGPAGVGVQWRYGSPVCRGRRLAQPPWLTRHLPPPAQPQAALRAWDDGVRRQAVELLLPQGQPTQDGGWPGGIRQQFRCGPDANLGSRGSVPPAPLAWAHQSLCSGLPAATCASSHPPTPHPHPHPSRVAKPMLESLLLRLKQHEGLEGRITAELLDEGDCVGEPGGRWQLSCLPCPPAFGWDGASVPGWGLLLA